MKCTVCNKLGHFAADCPKLPPDEKSGVTKEKTVMLVKLDDISDNKYILNLKINDQPIEGYIDMGSQCSLLQHSEAVRLGIAWSDNNLPVMRGIGGNIVMPMGFATVIMEI